MLIDFCQFLYDSVEKVLFKADFYFCMTEMQRQTQAHNLNIQCIYEGCSEIIETIAIFSNRLNIIRNNLHSHQVPHIWDLGLNYLTAVFNGYDPVAF